MRLAEPRWHSRYLCGQVARTRERKVSAVASDAAAWTGACCSDPMLRATTAAAEAEPQIMTVVSNSGASLTRSSPSAKLWSACKSAWAWACRVRYTCHVDSHAAKPMAAPRFKPFTRRRCVSHAFFLHCWPLVPPDRCCRDSGGSLNAVNLLLV